MDCATAGLQRKGGVFTESPVRISERKTNSCWPPPTPVGFPCASLSLRTTQVVSVRSDRTRHLILSEECSETVGKLGMESVPGSVEPTTALLRSLSRWMDGWMEIWSWFAGA